MEFNLPSQIVKDLNFGDVAKNRVITGVEKLTTAVKSTLGASGKCVIYEDARGVPVITKDGVTVAESVILRDPVENIGATLIKEAAKNTVREAGDGTTTATVLAESLLKLANSDEYSGKSIRDIKHGMQTGLKKVEDYLKDNAVAVSGDMLNNVATISCNGDAELGAIIADAYTKVGKDGTVLMEESESEKTYADVVEGVKLTGGLISQYFVTDKDKNRAILEKPLVLIVSSTIPNIRKIQNILEHTIKTGRSLLIIANVDDQVKSALLMNKVKGNIKVNIISPPAHGKYRSQTLDDLALITGAKVMNEELGDDLDLIQPDCLGEVVKSVTDDRTTVLTTGPHTVELEERRKEIKKLIKDEDNGYFKGQLNKRLAMLSGFVGVIKVGAYSKVEMKEKKDRVEDAIFATKAALQEGIVPGGGVALLNAALNIKEENIGEEIVTKAILSPFKTILNNAGIENIEVPEKQGYGIDVISGKQVNMIENGIIDPVLVTKTALKNAISVVSTIISADCVISNIRVENESN